MKSFLVVGLESSCTKIVAQMLALNLLLIDDISSWDGHEYVFNDKFLVVHKSLPHAERDNFLSEDYFLSFDYVIVVTRDWKSSLRSKINSHTPYLPSAVREHLHGAKVLKSIIKNKDINTFVFSYESALLLQEAYTKDFMRKLKILAPTHVKFINVNNKYQNGGKQ